MLAIARIFTDYETPKHAILIKPFDITICNAHEWLNAKNKWDHTEHFERMFKIQISVRNNLKWHSLL